MGYVLALNCVKVKKIIKYYMFFREKKKKVESPHKKNSSLYLDIVMTL